MSKTVLLGAFLLALGAGACGSGTNTSGAGTLTGVGNPDIQTVFTIVFENEDGTNVLTSGGPFFQSLAQKYGVATDYTSSTHPSLPNYIMLTSGSTNGINNDNDPTAEVWVPGDANLAAQLDFKSVKWRAYMESMGTPCNMSSTGDYSAHHDPWLYYTYVTQNADPNYCADHVVDFDQSFATDLASGQYQYMWITPNMCDDMHNCPLATADAWLQKTVTQIQASAAYKNNGAIFILFDEGNSRLPGAAAKLATIVVSEQLATQSLDAPLDHRSYLATVEDAFQLGRLSTTIDANSMDTFFAQAQPLP